MVVAGIQAEKYQSVMNLVTGCFLPITWMMSVKHALHGSARAAEGDVAAQLSYRKQGIPFTEEGEARGNSKGKDLIFQQRQTGHKPKTASARSKTRRRRLIFIQPSFKRSS